MINCCSHNKTHKNAYVKVIKKSFHFHGVLREKDAIKEPEDSL